MALIQSFARMAARSTAPRPFAALSRSTPILTNDRVLSTPMGTGVRHAGASALACGISVVALGGVAQGIGSVFAALVVGTARNPAIKDDLFQYTMIGFGMVELIMMLTLGFAGMLLFSE